MKAHSISLSRFLHGHDRLSDSDLLLDSELNDESHGSHQVLCEFVVRE